MPYLRAKGGEAIPQLQQQQGSLPTRSNVARQNVKPLDANSFFQAMSQSEEIQAEANSDHGEVVGNELSNVYKRWYKERLYGTEKEVGLSRLQGDPSKPYAEFDKLSQSFKNDLLAQVTDASPIVKEIVSDKLHVADNQLYLERQVQAGAQYSAYETKVTKEAIKSLSESASSATDIGTYQSYLNQIDQTNIKSLKKRGVDVGQYIDPKTGRVNIDALPTLAKGKILEDRAGTHINAINMAMDTGKLNYAEQLLDTYAYEIPNKQESRLQGVLTKTKREIKAAQLSFEFANLSESDARKRLAKVSDPLLRKEIAATMSSIKTNRDTREKRETNKAAASVYFNAVSDKWEDRADFLADPQNRSLMNKLPHSVQSAIMKIFDAGGESDPEALQKLQNIFDNPAAVENMDYITFTMLTKDVNKKDRAHFENVWKVMRSPETAAVYLKGRKYLKQVMLDRIAINIKGVGFSELSLRNQRKAQELALKFEPRHINFQEKGIQLREQEADLVSGIDDFFHNLAADKAAKPSIFSAYKRFQYEPKTADELIQQRDAEELNISRHGPLATDDIRDFIKFARKNDFRFNEQNITEYYIEFWEQHGRKPKTNNELLHFINNKSIKTLEDAELNLLKIRLREMKRGKNLYKPKPGQP